MNNKPVCSSNLYFISYYDMLNCVTTKHCGQGLLHTVFLKKEKDPHSWKKNVLGMILKCFLLPGEVIGLDNWNIL